MTYYELAFFLLIPIVVIIGIFASMTLSYPSDEITIAPLVFIVIIYFCVGGLLSVAFDNSEFVKTAEVPVNIVHRQMIDDNLILLTDQGEKISYSSYKDIVRANAEAPMVKRYYFKKTEFGSDGEKESIEFK